MSTGPTPLPEAERQGSSRRRRWFPRLRDIRIRSKLALILVVPVAAVVALAGIRIVSIGQRAVEAQLVRSLTALSADVSALTHELQRERMAAAQLLAAPGTKAESYNLHVRQTDERIRAYQEDRRELDDLPASVESRLKIIDAHLASLNGTRQEVLDRKQMPVAEAVLRYGVILNDLVAYTDTVSQIAGEGGLADSLRAIAAFARAKAGIGEEQAVTFAAIASGKLDEEQYASFVATLTSQQEALQTFALAATPRQRELVENVVTGDAVGLADRVSAELSRSVGSPAPVRADQAMAAIGAVHDLMRWAEVQLEQDLLADADSIRTTVVRQALIEFVAVLIILAVAIVLAVALARSLNNSLRRLREGALAVANRELPEAVNRLRDIRDLDDGSVDEVVRQVRDPIRLSNRDEIGQVAQAFNVVHREAVRVAAEQAALRTSVSAMFLNLARRSQTLVDRMIGELDAIERDEEDPKRLAKLFELDHLATRMRRNDENLLVLAGADSSPPRREDALLIDVLRAAQSEVEHYNRIEFGTVDTDISVHASAVNDVVRLLAELLDNATRFSPPTTTVFADGRRIRDYVIIQVEDHGLGMTDEQLEALNQRLAEPPDMDVSAFRLMGLAVVSRLSSRHGIRVELRRNPEGGTLAQITLPSNVVVLPISRREHLLPRQRQPLAVESGPAPAPSPAQPRPATPAPAGRPAVEPWQTRWETPAQPRSGDFAPVANTPATSQPAPPQARPEPVVQPTVVHQLSPAAPPLSGLPVGPVAGLGAALAATAPADAPAGPRRQEAEMPIYREMEAVWFRTHGQDVTQIFTMPQLDHAPSSPTGSSGTATGASTGGPAPASPPLPTRTPGQTSGWQNPSLTASPTPTPTAPVATESRWRTPADEGWERANRAAEPLTGGTTPSGLPKRIPQAQLVPGGVETGSSQRTRRAPEEVRGLLSAYHRGVQRGRSVGSEQYGNPTKEHSR
ncbi:MAG TPA: nitrate- and nitrite sensing domain-containing protein [Micromonosporaceae bacterium]